MESGVHYFSRSNFYYLIYGNATELYKPPLHCIVATISNIVITFIHVLHGILFDDLMTSIKNKLSAKSCFRQFKSCQIVIQTNSWIDESAKCHILIIPRNEFLQGNCWSCNETNDYLAMSVSCILVLFQTRQLCTSQDFSITWWLEI